eukprot:GEZU01017530.1.p1 GENE.GEZU01017530.1~~GEZU01017530.1.p1  ORF type:complete len:203 (+),score=28.91 GEZU01017530.1:297-905(+)
MKGVEPKRPPPSFFSVVEASVIVAEAAMLPNPPVLPKLPKLPNVKMGFVVDVAEVVVVVGAKEEKLKFANGFAGAVGFCSFFSPLPFAASVAGFSSFSSVFFSSSFFSFSSCLLSSVTAEAAASVGVSAAAKGFAAAAVAGLAAAESFGLRALTILLPFRVSASAFLMPGSKDSSVISPTSSSSWSLTSWVSAPRFLSGIPS